MRKLFDINSWNRKEHFNFFCQMEEPFYGLTVNISCQKAMANAKKQKVSFYTYYLHKTLTAMMEIENFRMRIEEGQIYLYEQVHASATVLREDNTFGFSYMEYDADILVFEKNVRTEIERVRSTTGLFMREFQELNLIHFSVLPWINFTSLSHARSFTFPDSCPKISIGKIQDDMNRSMPYSVHVHHALIDGYHLSLFLDRFQALMDGED